MKVGMLVDEMAVLMVVMKAAATVVMKVGMLAAGKAVQLVDEMAVWMVVMKAALMDVKLET